MLALFALFNLTCKSINVVSIPNNVVRDVRLVHDAGDIPMAPEFKNPILFLASISAAENSGDEIADGPYIDARTGEYVEPPGSKFAVVIHGQLKVDATIFGAPPFRHTPYRWVVREARPDPEDVALYSPFRFGGIVLLGYNAAEAGSRQFAPTYLLPSEWAADVAPAYRYVGTHKASFDPKTAALRRAELEKLMGGTNPILGTLAAKALSESGVDGWRYVRAHWSDSGGVRGAVYLLTVLKTVPPADSTQLAASLAKQASTADVHTAREIVLAGVAAILEPRSGPVFDAGNRLLDAYKAAMVAAGHPYGHDLEIAQLLQMTSR